MTQMLVALWISLALPLPSQDNRPKPPPGTHEAVVRGCLKGNTLSRARTDGAGSTEDFRLRLSKSIAKALKEYQNHDMELTGLIRDDDQTMDGGKTAKVGKNTTISIGAREDRSAPVPQLRELQVTAFREMAPACVR